MCFCVGTETGLLLTSLLVAQTDTSPNHVLIQAPTCVVKRHLRESTALHDAEELVLVDLAIAIAISLVNHLLELLVGHVLAELLSDALQVLEGDLAGLIVVEEAEHLDDLLAGVAH